MLVMPWRSIFPIRDDGPSLFGFFAVFAIGHPPFESVEAHTFLKLQLSAPSLLYQSFPSQSPLFPHPKPFVWH